MQKKFQNVSAGQNTPSPLRRSTPWHAVSVTTGKWCCEAARGVLGSRFLSREAPRLPLPQCTSPESCMCAYKHHADRRGPPRRKDDLSGLRRSGLHPNERRSLQGRREDD